MVSNRCFFAYNISNHCALFIQIILREASGTAHYQIAFNDVILE
jgi:hypothetical protein